MINPSQRLLLAVGVLLILIALGQWTANRLDAAAKEKPDNVLSVGLIDDTPPFCFYDDNNQLVGINIDFVSELARRLGKKVHIESVSFNRLTSGLKTKQYDLVSIGSVTPQRAKVVRYLHPHDISADVLIVHEKLASLQSVKQFRNQSWRIGVYNGTSYIQLLKDLGLEANMVIYPNQRDVFLAFYKHRVDAIIMNEDVASYIQGHLDPSMVILPERIRTGRQYAFAVRPEDLLLWKQADAAVRAMVEDGTFERIRQSWLHRPNKKVS